MARRLAVGIGVASVTGLPHLVGVRQGLDEFEAWGTAQGFAVVLHDDADGRVQRKAVFETVRDAVAAGDVERLFIFFSGHGLAMGTGDDVWLLSEAAEDAGEAVNVAKSAWLARRSGVPHVVFFADACRTPPTAEFLSVVGQPIFPPQPVPKVRVHVDQFYATSSGTAALDFAPAAGADAFGIFSRCLMDALQGRHDEILIPVEDGPASHALLASRLGDYLWTEVPALSAQKTGITQYPDCVPTSTWRPNALAWFDRSPIAPGRVSAPMPAPKAFPTQPDEGPYGDRGGADGGDLQGEERIPAAGFEETANLEPAETAEEMPTRQPWRPPSDPGYRERIISFADHLVTRPRPISAAGVAVSVSGGRIVDAWFAGRRIKFWPEAGDWHALGTEGQSAAAFLAVRTDDTISWVATAVLPGYVTTISVVRGLIQNVAFAAVGADNPNRDLRALALASASLQVGDLGFVVDDDVRRLVGEAHPTMAVLAAYARDRAGQDVEVERIYNRFRDAGETMPFDVALLAEQLSVPQPDLLTGFPMMTRGWALIDEIAAGERWMSYARRRLSGSAWATFTELSDSAIHALSQTERTAYA